MTVYMLDTNICSYIIRRRPETVRERLKEVVGRGDQVVISSVTYYEMRRGAASRKASPKLPGEVDAFVARLHDILAFGRLAADHAAALHARLSARGEVIGGNDLLIAGHALATEARLVTNNRREFDRVDGLVVEDWASP